MDEEGGQPVDDRKSTSELKWSLNRVTAPSLEPKKSWYILTKELCGYKPNYFARNEVYARFPAEIACVNTVELRSASVGCNINRQPKKTYVVSSFGLCCGLLKQRVYPDDGFIASPEVSRVIREINCMKLEEASAISDFGANDFGAHFENEAEKLKVQLEESNKTIDRLKTDIEGLSMKLMDLHSLKCKCGGSSQNSPVSNASDKSIEETKISPIGPIIKKRKINSMCKRVVGDLQDISEQYAETLGCVLGNYFIFGENTEKDQVRDIISETMDIVMEANNSKKPLEDVMHPSTYVRIMETMRVPDWVLLYFKIQAKLPDAAWQMLLNLTQLGRGGRNSDTPVLLTKNNIRAIRRHVFSIVRQTFGIKAMETEFHSAGVDLRSVLVWAVREQCLYSDTPKDIEFNIKLDGRPLGGKNQVAIGIVPINFSSKSSESYLSVYPLAIGNCKEERKTLIQLIKNLNAQKNLIKKHGIVIDGKHYNFKLTDDESFVLGGKGYGVEFCAFCDAVRACTSHGTDADEACLDCIRSKANIGRKIH